MTPRPRDDLGMMMPLVLLLVVMLVFAGAAVTMAATAGWKSTLRVDADTEAANVLASAENILTTLATGDGQDPKTACLLVHGLSLSDPCPTGVMDWTGWMTLPGNPDPCGTRVLEGCWRAKFTETTEAVQVTGRTAPLALPVWTITIQAAARCDALPGPTNAKDVCVTVTDETALTAETVTLPTYPTLLYSGRLWPDTEDPDTTDCSVDPTTATVWCAIPEQARPPAGTQAQVSATDVAASGLFINDLPTFSCDADYCTIAPGAADIQQARTVQSLPTTDLAADACTANPAVIAWTWPSGVAEVPAAALPADLPPDTPGMVVATGNITITDDIAAPANEPLLIVTGCHLVIDGACVYDIEDPGTGVITPADRTSEQRCSQPDPADAVPDTKQPLAISIENVIVVAAGGVWAADLQPVGCAYSAPALTITGSVITGRAGATSLLYNCDDDMPIVNGTEAIVAGYKRTSDLAADIAQWATADVAWWPGRDSGTWRRR